MASNVSADIPPAPNSTKMTDPGGLPSPTWGGWLQQLRDSVRGVAPKVFNSYTAASPLVVPADWHIIGAAGEPAYTNSWVANTSNTSVTPAYRKDSSGTVWLSGEIKSGTVTASAFTLPAGYRPDVWQFLPCYTGGGTPKDGLLLIKPDGTVSPNFVDNAEVGLSVSFPCSDRSPVVPGVFPVTVILPAKFIPSIVLAKCAATGTPTQFSTFPVNWQVSGTTLTINNIPGLLPSTSYIITIVAY